MIDTRYYTPSIEEFYVGFEYESEEDPRIEGGWQEQEVDERSIGNIRSYFNDSDVDIRVKYLDKADIEGLGWKQGELPYQFFKSPHFMLVELAQSPWYSITNTTDEDCRFRGSIKNKSELVRLMKQLEI